MLLENSFFRVLGVVRGEGLSATCHVALLPECKVYDGHFPGNPVCPGVCNMEMIKECACLVAGHVLRYSGIKQCRLTAIATPAVCPEVDVKVVLTERDGGYQIVGSIADDGQTYMSLKGFVVEG